MNKKGIITIGSILFVMLATPFLGTGFVAMQTTGQIHEVTEELEARDAALVLGAAAYGDRLSDILRDRVDTAIELYNNEKIEELIMSGAPNETEAMRRYAEEAGVKATDITEDPEGLNTLASIRNITDKNESLIIVTQKYHLPRAIFIANAMGIDAIGITADKSSYTKILEFKTREILATSKAMMDLYFPN